MEFGVPAFLWGLPLAGLPVVFHLLMKRQRKRVQFPSLLFLRKSDPHLDMKRKLREILLLAARVLLILFLILTLSRPSFENVPGFGRNVDVIIAVDNSGSMDAPAGDESTKLDVAKEKARRLVDSLNSGSRAAILPLVPETGAGETPAFHSDPEVLKNQIEDVKRTEASIMLGELFERIHRISEGMSAGRGKVLHVFTDLHKATWDREVGEVKDLSEDLEIVFNRVPTPKRRFLNVSVKSMLPPEGTVLPGHSYRVGATLSNTGSRDADVRVRYRDSSGEKKGPGIKVPANSSRVVRFPFTPEQAGEHWYIITVEGDGFRGDNRGAAPVFCRTEGRVILAGENSGYGTIPAAISPSGTGRHTALVPERRSPEDILSENNNNLPLMVVLTWQHLGSLSAEVSEKLRNYLRGGGAVLVLPDVSRKKEKTGNIPEWVAANAGTPVRPDEALVARILNPDDPEWTTLWEAGTPMPLQYFLVKRYLPLQLGEGFAGLAGPGSKRPLIATRNVGKGRLYVSGIAMDRKWTPMVTDPSGMVVVMFHRMATRGGNVLEGSETLFATAGERVRLPVESSNRLKIRSLVGDAIDKKLSETKGPVFPRAGAYRITAGKQKFYVSVSGAAQESTNKYVRGNRVPVMGARKHRVVDLAKNENVTGQLRKRLVGLSLFTPLALLTLLAWAFESWLATMLKKRSRSSMTETGEKLGKNE